MSRERPVAHSALQAGHDSASEPWILRNEGLWDRGLRIVAGLVALYLGWGGVLPGLWGAVARIFGVVPLVTGLLGWSPLYAILGLTTRPHTHRRQHP